MSKASEEQSIHFAGVFTQHCLLLKKAEIGDLQWAVQNGAEAVELFLVALKSRSKNLAEKPTEKVWPSLTGRLSNCPILILDPTEAQMSLEDLQKVFPGGIYGGFENFPSQATGATNGVVHEQIVNGNWNSIFKGISTKLKTLVWQPRQIVDFCFKHNKWLRAEGYATFFLMEKDGDFFVAFVVVDDSGLYVSVSPLSFDYVWGAESRRRIVLPQPETLAA